ncbi:MAG: nucleotidyltransferase domain-containing protein [Geminicoccaceae bacterium]
MAIRSPLHVARSHDRPEDSVVARFRERVLATFGDDVKRIVLFGSRARGEEHAESDWDFAVFFDHAPTEHEARALSDLTWAVQHELDTEIQSMARSGQAWLATDELACNVRDHGRVVYGPADIPMIERPVLQHARVALGKAERFAELSHETPDDRFEGVIHGAYYAMFHAARAALLAVEGSASTNHGRVVDTFARMVKRRRTKAERGHAAALKAAFEFRMEADYGNDDLTEAGRELRAQVGSFLEFCRDLVDSAAADG